MPRQKTSYSGTPFVPTRRFTSMLRYQFHNIMTMQGKLPPEGHSLHYNFGKGVEYLIKEDDVPEYTECAKKIDFMHDLAFQKFIMDMESGGRKPKDFKIESDGVIHSNFELWNGDSEVVMTGRFPIALIMAANSTSVTIGRYKVDVRNQNVPHPVIEQMFRYERNTGKWSAPMVDISVSFDTTATEMKLKKPSWFVAPAGTPKKVKDGQASVPVSPAKKVKQTDAKAQQNTDAMSEAAPIISEDPPKKTRRRRRAGVTEE